MALRSQKSVSASIDHADIKEQKRLATLDRYNILDTAAESAFDRLTTLAASFYQAPIALVSLVGEDRQWFKSRYGLDATETPRSWAFCAHAIEGDEPYIVNDATKDPLFYNNPLVTGEPDIRFYAGAPLVTPDGSRLGTLCIIDTKPREVFAAEDTEQLKLLADIVISEMELRIKNEELERAAQAKSEFLSMMSHDIRTPLSNVLGLVDALKHYEYPAEQVQLIEALDTSGSYLKSMLNDILDFARIEAGKIDLHLAEINVKKLLAKVTDLWQMQTQDKGLSFDISVDPQTPACLQMDDLRVSQILNNLLSNAIKFTDTGGVTLSVHPLEDQTGVVFQVTDTGVGMTEAHLSKLFRPFEQGDETIEHRYGGSGLGMSITAQLVAMMDGHIDVLSHVGEGTTFTVTLPLHTTDTDGALPCAVSADTQHILIVDDMHLNRMIASHMVSTLGYTFDTASNGEEAVTKALTSEFDLILMDRVMPRMDGIVASQAILADKPFQKIVMLSADDDADLSQMIQDSGIKDFLVKPLTIEGLSRVVLQHGAKQ